MQLFLCRRFNSFSLGSLIVLSSIQGASCASVNKKRDLGSQSGESKVSGQIDRKIRLRDGSQIDLKDYILDDQQSKIIEKFVDTERNFFNKPTREIPEILTGVNAGLRFSEALSLYYYTGLGYFDFQIYLDGSKVESYRDGNLSEIEVKAFFLAAVSALNRLPKYTGSVYFGAPMNIQDAISSIKPGKPFFQTGFISTSKNLNQARKFSRDIPMSKGMGCFVFTIESSGSGSDISLFALYPEEEEVLIPPRISLLVKTISRAGDCKGIDEKIYPSYSVLLSEI